MTCGRLYLVGIVGTVLAFLQYSPAVAQVSDPHRLLAEADRLAWLRVWTRAEPLYAKARDAFKANGDERNALYAEVSQLRGRLPTLPVPDVSGDGEHFGKRLSGANVIDRAVKLLVAARHVGV